jgi:arabinan endo-1,5-alpha-L-arabinosidase
MLWVNRTNPDVFSEYAYINTIVSPPPSIYHHPILLPKFRIAATKPRQKLSSRGYKPLPSPVCPDGASQEFTAAAPHLPIMYFLAALLLTTLLSLATAQTPGTCTGTCQGYSHDPSIVRRSSDGTYFRFSTGGGINVASASSLSGSYTLLGSALASGSSIDLSGNTDLWAPDVSGPYGDGYYYMFYAVSSFGTQVSAIGVARSTTMDVGTWTDLGSSGITSKAGSAYNAIDPNLIWTGSDYYITFGSFWGDLYQVKMANPPVKTAGTSSYQVAYNASGTHAVEGGFVYSHGSYYYLFFSSGICCSYDSSKPAQGQEYRINVCRSSAVGGPYVCPPPPTLPGRAGLT